MFGAKIMAAILCCSMVALANPNPQPSASQRRQREIERAKQMIQAGLTDQAITLLRELLRGEPDNADAHLLLGTALALVTERSEAIKELRRAIELRPTFAPAHYALGTALARFAELDAAIEAFQKAIKLDPRLADAHVSLALVLAQRKEFASARKHLTQAIGLQKNSPAAAYSHYLLAQVLAEENKPKEALRELEIAIKLRPRYAEGYLSQGLMKKRLLDDGGAFQAFKKAVELSPDDPAARYELGAAYLRGGEALQAIEHLRKAWELKPGRRSVLYQLCRALHQAGRAEEADECQQRLSAMAKTDLTAHDLAAGELNNEGVELEKAGNVAAALEKYRAALELNPVETVFRRNLALALCRLGRWEEAVVELREVLKANPEDADATKALYIALEKAKAQRKPK